MCRLALVATPLLTWATVAVAAGFLCAGAVDRTLAPAADVAAAETPVAAAMPALASGAAKPLLSAATGTRRALVLFARFRGESANPLPSWAADIFDPDLSGSFSHYLRPADQPGRRQP